MAGRFDFDSPGAAFVDTMAKVLAERKAEERQNMLDKLTMQAEDRANRAETRAVDQARDDQNWRKAQLDKQNWDLIKDRAELAGKWADPSKPLEDQNVSPEIMDAWEKTGALRKRPASGAKVTVDEAFAPPPGADYTIQGSDSEPWLGGFDKPVGISPNAPPPADAAPPKMQTFFAGTAEYQNREKLKGKHGNLIAGLLGSETPRDKELGAYYARTAEANDGIIPEAAFALLQPNTPVSIFDQTTGGVRNLPGGVAPGTQILTNTREPRQPFDLKPVGKTPDGKIIYVDTNGRESVGTNATGRDTSEAPVGIPGYAFKALSDAELRLRGNPQDADAINGYKIDAKRAVTAASIGTKAVKQWVGMYIDDPEKATRYAVANRFSAEDMADANQLIDAVGARDYLAVLTRPTLKTAEKPKDGSNDDSWWNPLTWDAFKRESN